MSCASSPLDRDLFDLPEGMRWREWMLRAEAAIFASAMHVSRETLAALVGDACRLDALLADFNEELKGRPYEIVLVSISLERARAMPRRCTRWPGQRMQAAVFTKLEMLTLSVIAYQQPITRAELSRGYDSVLASASERMSQSFGRKRRWWPKKECPRDLKIAPPLHFPAFPLPYRPALASGMISPETEKVAAS